MLIVRRIPGVSSAIRKLSYALLGGGHMDAAHDVSKAPSLLTNIDIE